VIHSSKNSHAVTSRNPKIAIMQAIESIGWRYSPFSPSPGTPGEGWGEGRHVPAYCESLEPRLLLSVSTPTISATALSSSEIQITVSGQSGNNLNLYQQGPTDNNFHFFTSLGTATGNGENLRLWRISIRYHLFLQGPC